MALNGDPLAALEPQDDDGTDHGDELSLDLLARARLLCQAANEIALPILRTVQQPQTKPSPPKEKRKAKASRPSTREEEDRSNQRPVSKADKSKAVISAKSREDGSKAKALKVPAPLPPIAAAPLPSLTEKKYKPIEKTAAKKKIKKECEQEEAVMPLPQIHATDEWRKQREVEKIRQAQERAKARVLRKMTPVEPLPLKSNQQADEDRERLEPSDIQGQMEANRRRALERVKLRKLEMAEEQAKAAAAKQDASAQQSHSDEVSKKAESFRHRTLQRLHAAKREAQALDSQELAEADNAKVLNQSEDNEEAEKQRKRLDKQRRRETAERLKKQQQIAEDQHRKEQELFEKGLSEFRTKKKEQDRVAKGLPPTRPLADPVDPVIVFDPVSTGHSSPERTAAIQAYQQPVTGEASVTFDLVEETEDIGAGGQDSAEGLTLTIATESGFQETMMPPSTEAATTRSRPKKVPSWKQAPVPILPAEHYTHKAMVSPSDSYAERFQSRTGRTSPTMTPDAASSPAPPQVQKRYGRVAARPTIALAQEDPASP